MLPKVSSLRREAVVCQIEFCGTSGFPLELTLLSRHATLSLLFMNPGCFFSSCDTDLY